MAANTSACAGHEDFNSAHMAGNKVWRDIWTAGQGVALVDGVMPTSELVERLALEYRIASDRLHGNAVRVPVNS